VEATEGVGQPVLGGGEAAWFAGRRDAGRGRLRQRQRLGGESDVLRGQIARPGRPGRLCGELAPWEGGEGVPPQAEEVEEALDAVLGLGAQVVGIHDAPPVSGQVAEQPQSDGSTVRQLVFDLLTQDLNGDPLWLVGSAAFTVGQSSVTVPAAYLGNGLSQHPYGSIKFEVTDCNHLDVTFTANSNLPAPIPTINGLTTYDRLFTPNGMTCE
jgi:hypothetical protein